MVERELTFDFLMAGDHRTHLRINFFAGGDQICALDLPITNNKGAISPNAAMMLLTFLQRIYGSL